MTTTPIPSLLRSMRQTLGITQDELATAWGVSRRTIAAWEAGETGTENLRYSVAGYLLAQGRIREALDVVDRNNLHISG